MVATRAIINLHKGLSLRALKNKLVLLLLVVKYRRLLISFFGRLSTIWSPEQVKTLAVDYVGLVQWPYVNKQWGVTERLDAVATHNELLTTKYAQHLSMGREDRVCITDLSGISEGCSLVLDRPPWFMREGELVVNLFEHDLRVASIAFLLGRHNGKLIVLIGAVQGIHKGVPSDTSLDIYKRLTKQFEGLRPRSLLIEALIVLSEILGASSIVAVCDKNRHHRHPYFGNRETQIFGSNYDEIWLEHGASLSVVDGFYEIPNHSRRKEITDIPSKKRAMYRRRYELLENMSNAIKNNFSVTIGSKT